MRFILAGVLIISLLLIGYILITRRIGLAWLNQWGLNLTFAAISIYLINFSGVLPQLYIPLNPTTISTVMVLGLPGVALLIGLKMILI